MDGERVTGYKHIKLSIIANSPLRFSMPSSAKRVYIRADADLNDFIRTLVGVFRATAFPGGSPAPSASKPISFKHWR
jgi:hypothetical protein